MILDSSYAEYRDVTLGSLEDSWRHVDNITDRRTDEP
jgi:hypothetical protein